MHLEVERVGRKIGPQVTLGKFWIDVAVLVLAGVSRQVVQAWLKVIFNAQRFGQRFSFFESEAVKDRSRIVAAAIAQKHYLQVTNSDFERGAQNGALYAKMARIPAQHRARTERARNAKSHGNSEAFCESPAVSAERKVPLVGLEPTTR